MVELPGFRLKLMVLLANDDNCGLVLSVLAVTEKILYAILGAKCWEISMIVVLRIFSDEKIMKKKFEMFGGLKKTS